MKFLAVLSIVLYHCCVSMSTFEGLVKNITETYFNSSRCIVFISNNNFSFQQLNIPVYFITHEDDGAICEEVFHDPLDAGCSGFIISVKNISIVLNSLLNAARHTVLRQSRKYVAFENSSSVEAVLSLPQLRFIPDFVLATPSVNESISLWTHAFVRQTEDEQNKPILLDIWQENSFQFNSNIFPDKLSNLRGRKLGFATFNYPPYAIIESGVYDGTEMRLGAELANQLNFTWKIVTDNSQWGEILNNGTGNGILGNVAEDKADFGFGALYLWYHEYQFLDFSMPYIRTGITCLAPKPYLLSGWRAPALPFSTTLWLAVGISLIVAATSICLLANLQSVLSQTVFGMSPGSGEAPSTSVTQLCSPLNCVLLVVGMTALSATHPASRQTSALKHCLTWFLFQCLLLATCYASSLVSFMTVPRFASPIETAEDIANTNLHWAATHDAWAFSLREASDPVHSKVYELFKEMDEHNLRAAALSKKKLAYSIERLPAGNFAVGDYLYNDEALKNLRLMKDDLYWEMVVTVVRKGSPYLKKLNNLINRLIDSGILLFWEGEVARKFLSSRYQLTIKNSFSSAQNVASIPTILSIQHLQGVFLILAIGLSFSSLIFLCEIYCIKIYKWFY